MLFFTVVANGLAINGQCATIQFTCPCEFTEYRGNTACTIEALTEILSSGLHVDQ